MKSTVNPDINKLLSKISPEKIPSHVAIIMDGNGRWAKQHRFGRLRGHRAGVGAIRSVLKMAKKIGVKYLTLYAFSTENWSRPQNEIDALWKLLIEFLDKEMKMLLEQGVHLESIGKMEGIPKAAKEKLKWAKNLTQHNKGINLVLALNYGSRDEIVDAVNKILENKKNISLINEAEFSSYLYTKGMPDPDLLIRTSGEQRLSNYLLWQASYAELYFTNVLWPDFDDKHFLEAIIDYQSRNRRFGGI
ncbi:MAG: hypothetical protein ACD_79C00130G0003 [uncultured bacterium]|nr:MAG: hypothetical protein ACD_79C00130G0003 [uncultured bacterium]